MKISLFARQITKKIFIWFHSAPVWHVGILCAAVVFVGRLSLITDSYSPINDGGIFLPTIEKLSKELFPLPETMGYNSSAIPFAYPPLGMYLATIVIKIFPVPSLPLFTVIPFILSVVCIYLYCILAYKLTQSRTIAALSTLITAIIPESFVWTIMGGGLTRSIGACFALSTLVSACIWIQGKSSLFFPITGLLLGLTYLSHPDSAVFATYSLIVLVVILSKYSRTYTLLRLPGLFFVGCIVVAPWFFQVLAYHGFAPFKAALLIREESGFPLNNLAWLYRNDFQYRLILLAACVGVAVLFKEKKHRGILLWLFAVLTIRATSMISFDIFPLTLLASIGITYIPRFFARATHRTYYYIVIVVIVLSSFPWTTQDITMQYPRLRTEDREAFEWVHTYTPETASFLIITPFHDWWRDNIPEWFPALAERRSVITVQGTEWLPNRETKRTVLLHLAIRQCNTQSVECIEDAVKLSGITFTHLYLSKMPNQPGPGDYCPLLLQSIRNSPRYRVMFGNNAAEIWEKIE